MCHVEGGVQNRSFVAPPQFNVTIQLDEWEVENSSFFTSKQQPSKMIVSYRIGTFRGMVEVAVMGGPGGVCTCVCMSAWVGVYVLQRNKFLLNGSFLETLLLFAEQS